MIWFLRNVFWFHIFFHYVLLQLVQKRWRLSLLLKQSLYQIESFILIFTLMLIGLYLTYFLGVFNVAAISFFHHTPTSFHRCHLLLWWLARWIIYGCKTLIIICFCYFRVCKICQALKHFVNVCVSILIFHFRPFI